MKRDYSKCTNEQFDAILEKLVSQMSTAQIRAEEAIAEANGGKS